MYEKNTKQLTREDGPFRASWPEFLSDIDRLIHRHSEMTTYEKCVKLIRLWREWAGWKEMTKVYKGFEYVEEKLNEARIAIDCDKHLEIEGKDIKRE